MAENDCVQNDDTRAQVGPFGQMVSDPSSINPQNLREKRKHLMQEIAAMRGRPLIVYAAGSTNFGPQIPIHINDDDLVPLGEILDSVEGDCVDFLIETPGGFAETTIKIVDLLRSRFRSVAFIIPHQAMSAGTILVMSGDEILMDYRSALGPIDPQFPGPDGRMRPAQAILDGIETIKAQIQKDGGNISPVYIPILRNVDPGILQHAENASKLSKTIVTEWLTKYKFNDWNTHRSSNRPVTPIEKEEKAAEIAEKLCQHKSWLSHGRPINIKSLEDMGLRITDYQKNPPLQSAIWNLWVNLYMLLSGTNIYKVYESATNEFWKFGLAQAQSVPSTPPSSGGESPHADRPKAKSGAAKVEVKCNKCGADYRFGMRLGAQPPEPIPEGIRPFPKSLSITCEKCGTILDLTPLKVAVEAQTGMPINFE